MDISSSQEQEIPSPYTYTIPESWIEKIMELAQEEDEDMSDEPIQMWVRYKIVGEKNGCKIVNFY